MKIMQSTIEQSAWLLLLLMVISFITMSILLFNLGHRLDSRSKAIQTQISCIGEYFNQTNRQQLTIPNLDTCDIQRTQ